MKPFRHLVPLIVLGIAGSAGASAQSRDFYAGRLVLDDNGGGGGMNSFTIAADPNLTADHLLTIPEPSGSSAEFVLAVPDGGGGYTFSHPVAFSGGDLTVDGIINASTIESVDDDSLRLNPSGDLVVVGNEDPYGSAGLEVRGNLKVTGRSVEIKGIGNRGLSISSENIVIEGDLIVNGDVTIHGQLYVDGDVDINGSLQVDGSGSRIGNFSDGTQLSVYGDDIGSADHLYVRGNMRADRGMRIGPSGAHTEFLAGSQSGNITYTLPTALPVTATSGTSMGNGFMQTDASGVMSWRNGTVGSASLNFASTATGATNDQTMTITGAAVGDVVMLGVPNGAQPAGKAWFQAWVSAANTVTVRFFNETGVAVDPAAATFSAMVVKP